MCQELSEQATSLISKIESETNYQYDENNPLYWFTYLNKLGKSSQTEETVRRAIDNFIEPTHRHKILEIVSRKLLTREICEAAVSKNGLNLAHVPAEFKDRPMCKLAVANDGRAIEYVPAALLDLEMYRSAINNDPRGNAIEFVPESIMSASEGYALCKTALEKSVFAIQSIPSEMITKELAKIAVTAPIPELYKPCEQPPILCYIPKNLITEEIAEAAALRRPDDLLAAPPSSVSQQFCLDLVKSNPFNLSSVPTNKLNAEIIDTALRLNPRAIENVPHNWLSRKRCIEAFKQDPTMPIEWIPDRFRKAVEKELASSLLTRYNALQLETPAPSREENLDPIGNYGLISRDSSFDGDSHKTIGYIFDIHIEHQLKPFMRTMTLREIKSLLDGKISELADSASDESSMVLIGGDVADSVEATATFYKMLVGNLRGINRYWEGNIVAILGNHELWDGNAECLRAPRHIDDIIDDYRQKLPSEVTLLENQLLIQYKGRGKRQSKIYSDFVVIDERDILHASVQELTEICENSTFLLLGGIGFSGLNPKYNAEMGLYRSTVSTEEDIIRSQRFNAVYEKILLCAKNLPVIVLTHTHISDWSKRQPNPRWIYLNGHTHRNELRVENDGTMILSDNQIGYEPKPWKFHRFETDVRKYDPFKTLPDGIHPITREQYEDFNRGQGITMTSMRYPGEIYALKRSDFYMFVLKSSKSLCLLSGGQRNGLNHDIGYYYSNLARYAKIVHSMFSPYQRALKAASEEVKKLGGTGIIHGCIVDIDWGNHIYINPFDGKMTPYFAWDMEDKRMFEDLASLLAYSPSKPKSPNGEPLLSRYCELQNDHRLPVLGTIGSLRGEVAPVPEIVLDKTMYEPSRMMRSIQYAFNQNVIRFWNEAVFDYEEPIIEETASSTSKLLPEQQEG